MAKSFSFESLLALRKKLLDLTNRNSLLNFKHPAGKCIRFVDELPNQVFADLTNGKIFQIEALKEPTEGELIDAGFVEMDDQGKVVVKEPKPELWAKHLEINTSFDLPSPGDSGTAKGKHNDRSLQTLLYPPNLEAVTQKLRSVAKTAIEESGSNVLFLAIGFLEWYEDRGSQLKRLAPLFTIPVEINREFQRGRPVYTLTQLDDVVFSNETLKQKLLQEFGIELPEINEDESPEDYFTRVAFAIREVDDRWMIRRYMTIGVFNFTKQAMYEDLNPSNWPDDAKLEDHPIIQKFFSSQSAPESDNGTFEKEHSIDLMSSKVHELYPLISDADSSQHSAIIDAIQGKSLVIEGPPGTGKSQTITNLIAAAINNGKSVLFVAEKMAALNVVKDRLSQAGLGDFCFELHSHKIKKTEVIEGLRERIKRSAVQSPRDIDRKIDRYEELKNSLNEYVQFINSQWHRTGLTIHEILTGAVRYREQFKNLNLDDVRLTGIDSNSLTEADIARVIDDQGLLRTVYDKMSEQAPGGTMQSHYWYGVGLTDDAVEGLTATVAKLNAWQAEIGLVTEYLNTLTDSNLLQLEANKSLTELEKCAEGLMALPFLDDPRYLDVYKLMGGLPGDLLLAVDCLKEFQKLTTTLEPVYGLNNLEDSGLVQNINNLAKVFSGIGLDTNSTWLDIKSISSQLDEIKSCLGELLLKLKPVVDALPHLTQRGCLGFDASGLRDLARFIELGAQLDPELYAARSEIFDRPEIDPILESMVPQLEVLVLLRADLSDKYELDKLPAPDQILATAKEVANGNLFSWFNSSWRAKRLELRSYSKALKPKVSEVLRDYEKLVDYKSRIQKLAETNETETGVSLGSYFKGIDTPIDRCLKIRAWYKDVRAEFGVGFDNRVMIGTALLTLDSNYLAGIKGLFDQGCVASCIEVVAKYEALIARTPVLAKESEQLPVQSSIDRLRDVFSAINSKFNQVTEHEDVKVKTLVSNLAKLEKTQNLMTDWVEKINVSSILRDYLGVVLKPQAPLKDHVRVVQELGQLFDATEQSETVRDSLLERADLTRLNELLGISKEFRDRLASLEKKKEAFRKAGLVDMKKWQRAEEGVSLHKLSQINELAIAKPTWLETWVSYLGLRAKLDFRGMGALLNAIENGIVSTANLETVCRFALLNQLAEQIRNSTSIFKDFNGLQIEALRQQFKEYDQELLKLHQTKIAATVCKNKIPMGVSGGLKSELSDFSLINHLIGLQKPRITIRSLVKRAGSAIQALKPVFMMSPMSVAQFLPPGELKFDLLIMDEASQIRPEDALGAIARGSKVVIVGDPKQLPPTSFFQKSVENDEDEEETTIESTESILETASPLLSKRRLRWHYRSRHESLIAFSNTQFYDGDLVIFPSPFAESDEFGVKFHFQPQGFFASGKGNGRNTPEARSVAKFLLQSIIDRPNESIGAVAMNSEQRDTIEAEFEKLIADDRIAQQAFLKNAQTKEPLFIKNLENVQGDERDVIVISMTYGPDKPSGNVMAQRFGPINQASGWRRLNVLFTRSKKRMHIFSSMRSGHILADETSSKGKLALKNFLDFAERKTLVHPEFMGRSEDSHFEISVRGELEKHGYECVPQLGVAGYFLDLAVKDPGMPGRFLVGIECDGASYHSAKSARDRDRLRQQILEGLGWTILRIWSTDWFKNPESQLRPILRALENLRSEVSEISQEEIYSSVDSFLASPVDSSEADTYGMEEQGTESAVIEIEREVEEIEGREKRTLSLRDVLTNFDREYIRPRFVDTREEGRLLRTEVLEYLLAERPCTLAEFQEFVPAYVRVKTDSREATEFLDDILDLIALHG